MTERQAARIAVVLRPGASRDEVLEFSHGLLRVRVKAPPIDGKANASLEKLLARLLGVPPSSVDVLRGARSRRKLLRVEGLSQEEAEKKLAAHLR